MKQGLQMRQVWPTSEGRAVPSPFEASEDFTQECWQANEVIAASPSDSFYSFLRSGQEVVRMLIVDPADPFDGCGLAHEPMPAVLIDLWR